MSNALKPGPDTHGPFRRPFVTGDDGLRLYKEYDYGSRAVRSQAEVIPLHRITFQQVPLFKTASTHSVVPRMQPLPDATQNAPPAKRNRPE